MRRFITACPRCRLEIAEKRRHMTPVVCDSCGCVVTDSDQAVTENFERGFLRTVLAVSTLAVIGFIQAATWGNHVFEATYLQAREWTGTNDRAASERLADICRELKKWDCVEGLYSRLASSGQTDDLLRLGRLQVGLARFKAAGDTLRTYFQRGGKDVEASYLFARALAETGRMDDASRYFDLVLRAKPGLVQITVVQNYVRYLLKANRLEQARGVIQRIRSQSETVSGFMEYEYRDITARLATSRS